MNTAAATYHIFKTENLGHLLIRTDANGHELVWEVGLSKKQAENRCRVWTQSEQKIA